jgi:hypothetical protein
MSFNLMETVKNFFTGEFTTQVSSALGEDNSGISKALTAIIPTGLAGILNKATSGNDGANSIFEMAKSAIGSVSGNFNLSGTENTQKGNSMFGSLFGDHQSIISNAVSKFSGIKDSSATSLITMALPAIMGILGKHAADNNLSASGLSGFLSSQKDHIMQALPSGLSSLASMLGSGSAGASVSSIASDVKSNVADEAYKIIDKPDGNNWLLPLIIIVTVIALLWGLSRGCNDTRPSTAINTDSPSAILKKDIPSVQPQWQQILKRQPNAMFL